MIYLASQSPRRAQLLEQLGVSYQLLLPDEQEDAEALELRQARESPSAYVQRVTELKLDAALVRLERRGLPPAPILCADTTVALGRTLLGKPVDAAQARDMLAQLSGQTHKVMTAVAVHHRRRRLRALSVSSVTFDRLSKAQVQRYVASGEPMGKAGAYAIQGRAGAFVASIRGSYSGIMGLPLRETASLLHGLARRHT